jgi:hypothetical protein
MFSGDSYRLTLQEIAIALGFPLVTETHCYPSAYAPRCALGGDIVPLAETISVLFK